MYKTIIKSKIKASFVALSGGDHKPAVYLMAENCIYEFVGNHALGGKRGNRTLIDMWFQRFLRILPNFQFNCEEIVVEGWPWATKIAVKLGVSWVSPSGESYQNHALQMVWLRWFKAVRILTIDDSQAFGELLRKVAGEYGISEAAAAPIEG